MVQEVIFSFHAKQRLEERGITEDVVLDVLQKPDYVITSFREGKVAVRTINSKRLQVVFKEELNKIVIITAMED